MRNKNEVKYSLLLNAQMVGRGWGVRVGGVSGIGSSIPHHADAQ